MTTAPPLDLRPEPSREETLVRLAVLAGTLVLFGPLFLSGAITLRLRLRRIDAAWARLAVLVVAAVGLFCWALGWPQIEDLYARLFGQHVSTRPIWYDLRSLWFLSVLLIPAGALLMAIFGKIDDLLRTRTIDEYLHEQEGAHEREGQRQSLRAGRQAAQAAPTVRQVLKLGTVIQADAFPTQFGVRQVGQWLGLEESALDGHILIVGTTGSGKSQSIKRLVAEVLEHSERDVFLIDGKADTELTASFRDLCWKHGRGNTPVFRLGTGIPGRAYDGLRGSAQEVYGRLVALLGLSEVTGDASWYANNHRRLLQWACYAPAGPPRSFRELEVRLDKDWLLRAWRGYPAKIKRIERLRNDALEGLLVNLEPLIWELGALVEPEPVGFALDTSRSAVFSLRSLNATDTAGRMLRFLVEDFKAWVQLRQQRPALLVIDEFGVLGATNVLALLAQARSAQLGIVLACQSIAQIKDANERQEILELCRTKILLATDNPEPIATLAGTRYQIESSFQHERGEATGLGTSRPQHTFKISPDQVRKLQPLEGFLIRQGYQAKLSIAPVPHLPPAPPEEWPEAATEEPPAAVEVEVVAQVIKVEAEAVHPEAAMPPPEGDAERVDSAEARTTTGPKPRRRTIDP